MFGLQKIPILHLLSWLKYQTFPQLSSELQRIQNLDQYLGELLV